MTEFTRRGWLASTAALAVAGAAPARAATEKVLRIAMTAADIPLTTGAPDNGFEGFRFVGYTLYDPLVAWDLSRADAPSRLVPGLAESWTVDASDRTKWLLRLRAGVSFHDGSPFTADAVAWNLAKLLDQAAPHFDPKQSAQVQSRLSSVASWRVTDSLGIELTTKAPDAFFPYQLTFLLVSSPAQFEALGRDWRGSPPRRPARGRSGWTGWSRGNGRNWCRTRPTGTRRADPPTTGSCCCRCRKAARAVRRCCPGRSIGRKHRRRTRSQRYSRPATAS